MVSLDGYHEGPGGELDWHHVDVEFNEFAVGQLDEADTLLFGRITYEGMAAYWPTPAAKEDDPLIAERMNEIAKVVVSRTLDTVGWANTRLVKGDIEAEIGELKRRPGKGIAILGSSQLTASLLPTGLVDELRIMVNPVVLGAGRSLFGTADDRIDLELLSTRTFASGNVLLTYRPRSR